MPPLSSPPPHTAKPVPISHEIADFVVRTTWASLPERIHAESVRALLNWVGCAVGGANTATVKTAIRGIAGFAGTGYAPVLGRSERFDMASAALVNCLASAAHTFDDTHLKTITHPTGPVAAAALAAGYARPKPDKTVSGEDLLLALVLGVEIECRISNAIVAEGAGANLGWYITGISGGIGAAIAVGRLIGLDHDQLVSAIGLAATQACGLRATHGSMAIAYVPGLAARNGLTAAYMAAAGFRCSDGSIDGRNGLLQVMSPNADPEHIRRALGSEFELLNNAYKPYPCGIVIHPAIDACLELARNPLVRHTAIDRLDLRVHPDALNLTWRKLPDNVLDAQVSLYHWVAAALVHARAGIEQGELPCIQDPAVRALQSRIFAVVDPALASDQTAARLHLNNGQVIEVRVEHASGSVAKPMSDAQLAAKFRALAKPTLGEVRAEHLLQLCSNMRSVNDAAEVFRHGTL
ncbi:MAG: MmgE/PrpD family protein [Pseudomonadota bacterium]